jgi:hypothetical protein
LSAAFLYTLTTLLDQFQSPATVFSTLTVVEVANHVPLVVVSAPLNHTVVLYTVLFPLCRTKSPAVKSSHAIIGIVLTLSGVITNDAHVSPIAVPENISALVAISTFPAATSVALGVATPVSTFSHNLVLVL